MPDPAKIGGVAGVVLHHLSEASRLLGSDPDATVSVERFEMWQRAQRLEQCRDVVTDSDMRRIVRGELDSEAWSHVERFLRESAQDSERRFLWLSGGVGAGKTVAALGAVAEIGGRYVTADEVRRGYVQETDEARDIRHRVTHCRLLVVDDVGAERDEAQARFALQELVNARQSGRRLTILTGNLTKDQIVKRYDPRTIDRIQPPRGAIVSIKGQSMRRAKP